MNRRVFLGSVAATAAGQQRKLLLPSDQPDEFGLRIMWSNPIPPIDQRTWLLKVGGLVEKPQSLSVEALRKFPYSEQSARMKCVQCWSARATWGGFRFAELLESVKPLPAAKVVRIDCADKWFEYMSIPDMLSPRVLMTLDLGGKPLPDQHGAPLRLIDPTRYGYMSAKLVTSITFLSEGKGSMACDNGAYYSVEGKIVAGYDHPLDLGPDVRKKIAGGEITEY